MIARAFRRSVVALAIALSATYAMPARASDFTDCASAVGGAALAGPEAIAAVAQDPKILQCAPLVTDPGFIALATALAALKAKGKFGDADQCINMLPNLLAEAATASGVLASTAQTEWGCACRVAVVGLDAFNKGANAISNVANSCGKLVDDAYCSSIGGTDDDCNDLPETPPAPPEDNACRWPEGRTCYCDNIYTQNQYGAEVHVVYDWHPELQGDLPPTSGVCVNEKDPTDRRTTYVCSSPFDPSKYSCAPGSQCASSQAFIDWHNSTPIGSRHPVNPLDPTTFLVCAPCSSITNGVAKGGGGCGCADGYQPTYETGVSGKQTLVACSCPAPMQEGYHFGQQKSCACPVFGQVPHVVRGKLVCACPTNQQLENGTCRSCRGNEVYNPDTLSCERPTLPPKGEFRERIQPLPPTFETPPATPIRPGVGLGRQRPPTMTPPQRGGPPGPPLRPAQRFRPPFRPIEPIR